MNCIDYYAYSKGVRSLAESTPNDPNRIGDPAIPIQNCDAWSVDRTMLIQFVDTAILNYAPRNQ